MLYKKTVYCLLFTALMMLYACSNDLPVASFTVNRTAGCYPLAVTFDASSSQDPDGSISSYSWNFGDSQTGTGVNAVHTYTATGVFTATLTVKDDSDAEATAIQVITVSTVNGLWNGTATNTVNKTGSAYMCEIIISQTTENPTILNCVAIWDHLPEVYWVGTGTIDTATNVMNITFSAQGYNSFTISGNITDDSRSFTGTIDGSGFTQDVFTMTWQSEAPSTFFIINQPVDIDSGPLNAVSMGCCLNQNIRF